MAALVAAAAVVVAAVVVVVVVMVVVMVQVVVVQVVVVQVVVPNVRIWHLKVLILQVGYQFLNQNQYSLKNLEKVLIQNDDQTEDRFYNSYFYLKLLYTYTYNKGRYPNW